MIQSNISSMSRVEAKVDIYNGATLVKTCTCSDVLKDFKLSREGASSKFFGFGVIHKLTVNIIDISRTLFLEKNYTIELTMGDGVNFVSPFPTFYIKEIKRDQKTNELEVEAYDKLYEAGEHTLADVNITAPYTVSGLASACALALGISVVTKPSINAFSTSHPKGGNFEGEELLSDVFTSIAEVTQTIYFLNKDNALTFKRLDIGGNPLVTVEQNNYFECALATSIALGGICSTTQLGDNLEHVTDSTGVIQYVRDNPLWELHDNRASLVTTAANELRGLVIQQFDFEWIGNYLLEIGDKFEIVTTEISGRQTAHCYLLNDRMEFNGFLSSSTSWEYTGDKDETASNPANIGEKINQTFARVDKLEKNITLYVGDAVTSAVQEVVPEKVQELTKDLVTDVNGLKSSSAVHTTKITQLELSTGEIESTVSEVTNEITNLQTEDESLSGRIDTNTEQIGSLSVTVNSINASVSDTQTQVSTLQTQVENQDGEIQNLKTAQTTTEETISRLQLTTDGISQSVKQTQESVTVVQGQISTSQQEAINTAKGYADTLAKASKDYTDKQVAVYDTAINQLNTTVSEINVTTSGITQRVENTEKTVTSIQSDIEGLEGKVEAVEKTAADLQVTTNGINATVSSVQETISTGFDNVNKDVERLTKEVEAKVTADDVSITIKNILEDGVTDVTTTTGFTFNQDGLTVAKSGREMKTQITEDGMTVFKDTLPVLTADSAGVDAKNLSASTYLVIGTNSRFENFGSNRTACFWIGD